MRPTRNSSFIWLVTLSLLTAAGCRPSQRCSRDSDCPNLFVCKDGKCIQASNGEPDGSADGDADMEPDAGGDVAGDGNDAQQSITEIWGGNTESDHPGQCEDTYININQEKNSQAEELSLYTWPQDQVANAILFRCDLGSIPPGATILEAWLHLHQFETGGDAEYTSGVHKLINFNPVFAEADGYQWSNQGEWTPNNCCANNAYLAQSDIDPAEDVVDIGLEVNQWVTWRVTNMVQDWVGSPAENFGMLVNSDAQGSMDSHRSFRSNEFSDAPLRPKLVITYSTE